MKFWDLRKVHKMILFIFGSFNKNKLLYWVGIRVIIICNCKNENYIPKNHRGTKN